MLINKYFIWCNEKCCSKTQKAYAFRNDGKKQKTWTWNRKNKTWPELWPSTIIDDWLHIAWLIELWFKRSTEEYAEPMYCAGVAAASNIANCLQFCGNIQICNSNHFSWTDPNAASLQMRTVFPDRVFIHWGDNFVHRFSGLNVLCIFDLEEKEQIVTKFQT